MINIRELVNKSKTRVINLVWKLREKQLLANNSNGYAKSSHLISKINTYRDLNRAELNLEVQIQLRQIIQENIIERMWINRWKQSIKNI